MTSLIHDWHMSKLLSALRMLESWCLVETCCFSHIFSTWFQAIEKSWRCTFTGWDTKAQPLTHSCYQMGLCVREEDLLFLPINYIIFTFYLMYKWYTYFFEFIHLELTATTMGLITSKYKKLYLRFCHLDLLFRDVSDSIPQAFVSHEAFNNNLISLARMFTAFHSCALATTLSFCFLPVRVEGTTAIWSHPDYNGWGYTQNTVWIWAAV